MVSASHGLLHRQCATVGCHESRSAEVSKNATRGIEPIGLARISTQLEPAASAARRGGFCLFISGGGAGIDRNPQVDRENQEGWSHEQTHGTDRDRARRS